MVTTLILLTVSGVVINGVLNMTQLNSTVTNRSAMFAGVRNATALLQQEVGQAGRVSLPAPVTRDRRRGRRRHHASTVSSAEGMFVGEHLVIGTGGNEETVAVDADQRRHAHRRHRVREPAPGRRAGERAGRVLGRRRAEAQLRRHRERQRLDRLGAEDLRRHQRQRQDGLRRIHLRPRQRTCSTATRWTSTRRPRRRPASSRSWSRTCQANPGRHALLHLPGRDDQRQGCS